MLGVVAALLVGIAIGYIVAAVYGYRALNHNWKVISRAPKHAQWSLVRTFAAHYDVHLSEVPPPEVQLQ